MPNLAVRIAQHVEETVEEFREKVENVDSGDIVHDIDPGDEETADVRALVVDVLFHQRDELLHVEVLRLHHDLLEELVEKGGCLHVKEPKRNSKVDISFTSTSTSAYNSHRLLKISFMNSRITPRAALTMLYSASHA